MDGEKGGSNQDMQWVSGKGAHRAMEAREHAEANNGRTPRHTREHA